MTLAICQRCGHEKQGAFTPCPACRHDPFGDRLAQAKALLLSDLHGTPDELRAAAAMIKAGEEVPFARSVLHRVLAEMATAPRRAKKPSAWRRLVWSPIGFVLLLGVLEAISLLFFRARALWMRH